ncbi:MAG: hypothetical protein AAGF10_02425, partial [Verrucomicrobiota bacterium]
MATLGALACCLIQAQAGEVVIATRDGQQYSGDAVYWRGDMLVLDKSVGDGQVAFQFTRERVESVRFVNESLASALDHLRALGESEGALAELVAHYRRSEPFLEFLPRRDRLALAELVDYAYARGDDALAVGVALRLVTCIEDLDTQRRLQDAILLGYARLELDQELLAAALEQATRYGDSALGAYLLARQAYLLQDYESALSRALEPVVFSSQYPMAYLEHTYAVAILAAEA